jgi:hypothetical protein
MLTRFFSRVRPVDRVGPRTGPNGTVLKTPAAKYVGKGRGNWACWDRDEKGLLLAAAERWAKQLPPGDRYWLCWNVDDAWCRLQQKLVLEAGWVPVVGADVSMAGRTTVLPGAVFIDFLDGLPMPDVWTHFPLELVFGWVERLAFWHADVLLPRPVLRAYARQFEAISGPVTAAAYSPPRNRLRPRTWNNNDRWFEVIGCTTREASRGQWGCGGGWWRHFQNHPNCAVVPNLHLYSWDHGGGIRYWEDRGGQACRLPFQTRFHVSHYHRPDLRPAGRTLAAVDLPRFAAELDVEDLLD